MKKSEDKKTPKYEINVLRAHAFSDTRTGFDAVVNGITIYGMVFIEHDKGDFVSFPSKQDAKDSTKYWNHVYFDINKDSDQVADLKKKIEEVLK